MMPRAAAATRAGKRALAPGVGSERVVEDGGSCLHLEAGGRHRNLFPRRFGLQSRGIVHCRRMGAVQEKRCGEQVDEMRLGIHT